MARLDEHKDGHALTLTVDLSHQSKEEVAPPPPPPPCFPRAFLVRGTICHRCLSVRDSRNAPLISTSLQVLRLLNSQLSRGEGPAAEFLAHHWEELVGDCEDAFEVDVVSEDDTGSQPLDGIS